MPTHDDIALAAHLMRRVGFGATRTELEALVEQGYEETVEQLLPPESQPEVDECELYRYHPQYLGQTGQDALKGADILKTVVQGYSSDVEYGSATVSRRLRDIAMMHTADVGVRVFYTDHGNFDTHAAQATGHAKLWSEGSRAIADFYCSDEHLNAISWFGPDGPFCVEDSGRANMEPFAERLGHWGETGPREGEIDGPSGIAFDSNDDLYVVDSRNDRVQKFSSEGGYLLSFPSTESSGAALDHPADVAVDSDGDVYVTDWGNMRVQIYDPDGDVLTALYGDATVFSRWGRRRVEADAPVVDAYRRIEDLTPLGRFRRPVSISVDEQDRIIVTDSTRGRLQVYSKKRGHTEAVLSI